MSELDTVTGMTSERPITTAEAAALAGTSARMIRHYVANGRIVPMARVANTMLFHVSDVLALAATIERRWRRGAA
jgi:DNA-binding transcriptional MerR regulator